MRIHYLQHVPFEDLANIEEWAEEKGHTVTVTRLFTGDSFPELHEFDLLIIMGGPMNIYEDDRYPWLTPEKDFIKKTIQAEKKVLGICLGAQLIADVLGGKVKRNPQVEIGWFPIIKTKEGDFSILFKNLPARMTAFHWHGDTFEIPPQAIRIAQSEACENQAFEYNGRVFGLQFHLESSEASVKRLIEHCSDEIVEGNYIQTGEQMLAPRKGFSEIQEYLYTLLDTIEAIQ